jgi:hypothetical protein
MSAKLLSIVRWSAFAVLLCLWLPCHAQYSATVQGTVTDSNGAVVQGATITLTNIATNIANTATTSNLGSYHFPNLLPADYKITVVAPGFEKAMVNRHVSTGETAGVNIALTVGGSTMTVEVTAAEVGLNPDETRLEYTLGKEDLSAMPLPDRATLSTLRAAPGIVGTIETGNGSTNTNISIGQAAPDARANGRPNASNVYLLDRIPISSTENTGAVNMVPNTDMLSEIALQTTSFSVENGATSSLQVDFTSKSGGNQFHGDFDTSYTSKPFSASPDFGGVAPFHRKYFMGAIGGPIVKNHTFFFGSVERVDNLSAIGASGSGFSATGIGAWGATAKFPNPAAYEKLFTYGPDSLTNQKVTSKASDYYPVGSAKACNTPATFNLPCETPVTVAGTFNQNPALAGQQYNVRVDHSFRQDNDRMYIGYFGTQQNSDYLDPRPAFNTKTPSQTYYFSGGESHVFTANLTNQLNAGIDRFWGGSTANPLYTIYPHGTMFSFEQDPGGAGFAGGPQSAPDSPYLGADSKEHIMALRDYITWIKGKHNFEFGFQSQVRNYWQNSSANYSRPYNTWFSDLLEMLQGQADETSLYTIGAATGKWTSQVYGAQETQFAGYAQDGWRIKPNLQVTLGIRWDDFGNPSKFGDNAAQYSNTFLASGSNLLTQVQGASAKVVNQAFTSGQTWNFLPRAAFTWSPAMAKRLVVRGGMGLFQDAINLNQITANLPTTTPVRLTLTLHDAAEGCGGTVFWCGVHPWTGKSGVAGEPDAFAFTGTQGTSAPFGIPYPVIPVAGISARGLALGPNGMTYQSDMYGVDPKLKPQSTSIWSFGLEQELRNAVVVAATYSGSYSYNQFLQSASYNTPPGSTLAATAAGYTATPWSDVGKINLIRNQLTSNFNSLILTAQQRSGNLNWEASYLWSHSLGNPGTGDNPSPYTATASYGTTNLDVHQRITLSGSYQLSAGTSALSKGWSLGGIVIGQDGTPFTVYSSQDVNNDGNKDANNDLPNVVFQPGSGLHYGKYSNAQWKTGVFGACGGGVNLNSASGALYDAVANPLCPFQTVTSPNAKTLQGNEQYNAFRNPGYWDVDLSLQKKIVTPWFGDQKSHFTIRMEATNAFNHANLNGVGTSIAIGQTTNFGEATSAANPRILQFGGRLEF